MYAILRVKKHKNLGSIKRCENHQCRKVKVPNANEKLTHKNKLILGSEDFTDDIKNRLNEYKKERTIRKDAVLAIELLLTASPEFFDNATAKQKNDWIRTNIAFLKKEYSAENIAFLNVQLDEKTLHLSCMVIPMHEGRLCCKHYLNGPGGLSALQDRYWLAVQQHGLKRGLKGSKAKHKTIRQFYTEINQATKADNAIKKEVKNLISFDLLKESVFKLFDNFNEEGTRKEKNSILNEIVNTNKIELHNKNKQASLIKELRCSIDELEKENKKMKISEEERKKARVDLVSKRLYEETKNKLENADCENKELKSEIEKLKKENEKLKASKSRVDLVNTKSTIRNKI